jgi:hypothetical protein
MPRTMDYFDDDDGSLAPQTDGLSPIDPGSPIDDASPMETPSPVDNQSPFVGDPSLVDPLRPPFSDSDSPWHLLGDGDSQDSSDTPYHLISPTELNFGDTTSSFRNDASAFYDNESAMMILLFGKDRLTDFVPSMESVNWGVGGAAVGGFLGLGIGFDLAGPLGGYELMQAGAEIGFEVGFETHEAIEDLMDRASALNSLIQNNLSEPIDPSATPSPQPNYSPDLNDKGDLK